MVVIERAKKKAVHDAEHPVAKALLEALDTLRGPPAKQRAGVVLERTDVRRIILGVVNDFSRGMVVSLPRKASY